MKRIPQTLIALLFATLILQGCKALNPFCGSARPAPTLTSLSVDTVTFAQVQQGFLLTVTGSDLVSSSVVVVNGTTLSTQVVSKTQAQATLTGSFILGPGTASVTINTPGGNSSDLDC